MTINDVTGRLLSLDGSPRVVVKEESPPKHNRMAVTFFVHRQHHRRFKMRRLHIGDCVEVEMFSDIRPVGIVTEVKFKSHKWIKENSHRESQITFWGIEHDL